MNIYTKNLSRIEFIITYNCTGKCIHCSNGFHKESSEYVKPTDAAEAVRKISSVYGINSVMTFGGEPMLYPESVFAVHAAARDAGIPCRQLITNGYFTGNTNDMRSAVKGLYDCGVNDILISVDAFHQATIPEYEVLCFAKELLCCGLPVRTNPAWLVSREHNNQYNKRTKELVELFLDNGVKEGSGNVIFPEGNAAVYLAEYFAKDKEYTNPYADNPYDIKSVSIEPDGKMLGANIYKTCVLEILENYKP